jgi:hypothetical protein
MEAACTAVYDLGPGGDFSDSGQTAGGQYSDALVAH